MRRVLILAATIAVLSLAMFAALRFGRGSWAGVDETIVEKAAEQGGRPARPPLLNTDRGDLLLFLFLTAGAVGGFVSGYVFRGLFAANKGRPAHGVGDA